MLENSIAEPGAHDRNGANGPGQVSEQVEHRTQKSGDVVVVEMFFMSLM